MAEPRQRAQKPSPMTPEELAQVMDRLGLKPRDMVIALDTKRRTLQDYLSGKRRIPGICRVACDGLILKNDLFMAGIPRPKPYMPSRLNGRLSIEEEGTTT